MLPERKSSVSRTPCVSRGCCCSDPSMTENSTSLQPMHETASHGPPRGRCAGTHAVPCCVSHQDLLLFLVESHANHRASAHDLTSLISLQARADCLEVGCCCELSSPEGLHCAMLRQLRQRLGLVLCCEDRLDHDAVVLGLPQRAAPVPVQLAALRHLPSRACAAHREYVGTLLSKRVASVSRASTTRR